MSYHGIGFTLDEEADVLTSVHKMLTLQEQEARARKAALIFGIAGALFAAVRLGIVFAPKVRRKRPGAGS